MDSSSSFDHAACPIFFLASYGTVVHDWFTKRDVVNYFHLFFQKLQHVQAEADKEANTLRRKVTELEQKLKDQQNQKKRILSFHR